MVGWIVGGIVTTAVVRVGLATPVSAKASLAKILKSFIGEFRDKLLYVWGWAFVNENEMVQENFWGYVVGREILVSKGVLNSR